MYFFLSLKLYSLVRLQVFFLILRLLLPTFLEKNLHNKVIIIIIIIDDFQVFELYSLLRLRLFKQVFSSVFRLFHQHFENTIYYTRLRWPTMVTWGYHCDPNQALVKEIFFLCPFLRGFSVPDKNKDNEKTHLNSRLASPQAYLSFVQETRVLSRALERFVL